MAGEWKQGKPGGKWRGDAAAGRPGQPDPKWKTDKPTGSPVRTGWWLKAGAAGVGAIAVLAGITYWLLIPKNPPSPVLVAVGADPSADAGKLNVPLDLYGWLGGKKLIDAIQERAKAEGDTPYTPKTETGPNNTPLPLPAEDGLTGFVSKYLARYDPVVLYLGVHTGVGEDGSPHLVGSGGTRVRVGKLLTALTEGLTPTRSDGKPRTGVVVLLDPGRRRPDPLTGHLHHQFAVRLKEDKEVAAALDKLPQMVVICGAEPGDRGWESEELQQTAFARSVLRGLQATDLAETKTLRAGELFEFVRRTTAEWSVANRPTVQRPFLLPDTADGQERAKQIRLYVQPESPPPAADPWPQPSLVELTKWWDRHDEIADRKPSPASYAPRAWRRFRELLLRYEQAVRAGEPETVRVLNGELTTLDARIGRAAPPAPASADRGIPSLALAAVANGGGLTGRAFDADNVVRRLSQGDGANQLRGVYKNLWDTQPAEVRPAEAHLPVMVGHFYSSVLQPGPKQSPSPPPQWSAAFDTRRLAERAAVGLPDSAAGPLFPERVWPAVRQAVLDADKLRRGAEDRLFATDPNGYKQSEAALADAKAKYAAAVATAAALHRAADVRDRALADLPFYSRWAADANRAETIPALLSAWDRAQELNDALADPAQLGTPARVALVTKLTDELEGPDGFMPKVRTAFTAQDDRLKQPADQSAWWELQHLLATPFVKGRKERLTASRNASLNLLAGSDGRGKVANGADGATVPEATTRAVAVAHAKFARRALSGRWLSAPDSGLPTAAVIDTDIARLETGEGWQQAAATVGGQLARHYAALSKAVPSDYKSLADIDREEQVHRSAVALEDSDRMEPAAVAGRVRWRELLADHARRVIADHWYDEKFAPGQTTNHQYFREAAELYRGIAKQAMAQSEGAAVPPVPHNDWLEKPLPVAFDTLHLNPSQAAGITWTSDRHRSVGFTLTVPKDMPDEVVGTAVVIRKPVEEQLQLLRWQEEATATRPSVPVVHGQAAQSVTADLVAKDTSAAVAQARGSVRAEAYFRGQRPLAEVRIDLNRVPNLVLLDPGPTDAEKGARVAIRADRDVPLGSVVILVDYSGSMLDPVGGLITGSKFNAAVTALNNVLEQLPLGTPLKIRIFSDKEGGNGPQGTNTLMFPADGGPARVTWTAADPSRLQQTMKLLGSRTPQYFTPLVDSIRTTIATDFQDLPADARTLVVLTDGVDEKPDDKNKPDRAERIASRITQPGGLRDELTRLFKDGDGREVSLQVVQFGLDPEDKGLSDLLFSRLDAHRQQPANVWPAGGTDLTEQLLFAIRPKLKVTSETGKLLKAGLDVTGWKTTVDKSPGPPTAPFGSDGRDLKWSPDFPAVDRYIAEAIPSQARATLPLQVRDGDRLILGFAKGDRGIRIRRELYADYWPAEASAARRDGRWRLTVPKTYRDFQSEHFHALGFVERTPNHRMVPPRQDEPELSQPTPDLTWWRLGQVRFAESGKLEEQPPAGTVFATRTYGLKAPAWELTAKWGKDRSGAWLPARVTTWVADGSLPLPERILEGLETPDFNRDPKPADRRTGDDYDISVRLSVEPKYPGQRRVDDESEPKTPQAGGWLIVRITYPKDRPIVVRPLVTGAEPTHVEHRYYPGQPDSATDEYTGVFGPNLSPEALRAGSLRLKVVSVKPLLDDPGAAIVREPKGPGDNFLRPANKDEDWPKPPPRFVASDK